MFTSVYVYLSFLVIFHLGLNTMFDILDFFML